MKDYLFLPYELSVIAREKGFDNELCFRQYREGAPNFYAQVENKKQGQKSILAPLYHQIINWLRNEHKIIVYVKSEVIFVNTVSLVGIVEYIGGRYETVSDKENEYVLNKAIEQAFKLI